MKRNRISACILMLLFTAFSAAVASALGIVLPADATDFEKAAARELQTHLAQALQGEVELGTTASARRRILLGKAGGLPPRAFDDEEWEQKALSGDALAIRGGGTHGLLYGIYDFLENKVGVIWMDEFSTHIPKLDGLSWEKDFHRTGKPSIRFRGVYSARGVDKPLRHRFLVRNRQNHFHDEKFNSGFSCEMGVFPACGSPRACHTFFNYTSGLGDDMLDCFSWSSGAKKRIRALTASGPGQICYTNPKTRRVFKEKLRKYIEGDRKYYSNLFTPKIYVIMQNDNDAHCQCDACLKVAREHGMSGLLLDFVNELADDIAADYPDIRLMTAAYMNAKEPPRGIVPRKNVIIEIALLGGEYSGEHRNTHRPFTDPSNKEGDDLIRGWAKLAPLAIWDYWTLNADKGYLPTANAVTIPENIRYYVQHGVTFLFAECNTAAFSAFHPLSLWIGMRFANDCNLDVRTEIARFISAYFGPAATPMQQYFDFLQARNLAVKGSVCDLSPNKRTDLDDAFFRKANAWLDQAESLAAASPEILQRIARERISVDYARLLKRDMLEPLTKELRDRMASRLTANFKASVNRYVPEARRKAMLEKMDAFTQGVRADIPPLKGFEDRNVIADFTWPELARHRNTSLIDDPLAAGGKAVGFIGKEGRNPADWEKHLENRGIQCGIYNYNDRRHLLKCGIPREALPADEQYHWYYAGRASLTEKCFLWMHWTWLSQQNLNGLYDTSGLNNLVDVFLSIRVAGPKTVAGKPAWALYAIDRVVICKAANAIPKVVEIPLPEEYAGRKAALDLHGLALQEYYKAKMTADRDATDLCALRLASESTHEKRPFQIGMQAEGVKGALARLHPKLTGDEKYHLYSLGVHKIPANGYIYAHSSGLLRIPFSKIYAGADDGRAYEVVISVKAEGPAYCPGSQRENAVSIDRLILLYPR